MRKKYYFCVKIKYYDMNRIEEILKEKGIKKAEFAELLNTSRQNVNSLLKNPTNSKLKEIATALNVPLWQLFASPEEITEKPELTALIRFRGQLYQADTIEELKDVVKMIERIPFNEKCPNITAQAF